MKTKIKTLVFLIIIGVNPLYCGSVGKSIHDNPTVTVDELLEMINEKDMDTFKNLSKYLNNAQIDNLYGNLSNELKLDSRDLEIQKEILTKKLIKPKDKRFSTVAEQIILLQNRVNMYQRKLVYLSNLKKK